MSQQDAFRVWVPEWFIRLALLAVVLPSVVLFALSSSNVNAAAGYYGITPNDVQYSLIILYGSMAGFIVLEGRFFKNIASKDYLLISVMLLIATCYVCYVTRNLFVLLAMRSLQGMLTCATININLTLMFSRLQTERGKEIAYSVTYGILLSVIPLSTLITAHIIDAYNFNVVYKCAAYSYLPGAVAMVIIMKQVRLHKRVPLYKLDWASFVPYVVALCTLGYVLNYGQQYEWLYDGRIRTAMMIFLCMTALFLIRQPSLKRPYLYLSVFKAPRFVLGAFLLFAFYIIRGAFGLTTGFIATILGHDPIHLGCLLTANVCGIILSVIIASRLLLAKRPYRVIFMIGFTILLAFHVYMLFLFTTQVDTVSLILPLFMQGMGAGMLMVPVILFLVSAAPPKTSNTGSAVGIFIRFFGFCSSIALINYFQLAGQKDHLERFQQQVSIINPAVSTRVETYKTLLTARGMVPEQAAKVSAAMLNKGMVTQAQLKFSVDYYYFISILLVAILLILALIPLRKPLVFKSKEEQPVPVIF